MVEPVVEAQAQELTAGTGVRLVLASGSPRRAELLNQIGVAFEVMVSEVDETHWAGEQPQAYVARLAEAKARAVYRQLDSERVVLGADTTVVTERGEVLGKPIDRADGHAMLAQLAATTHRVFTGVCVMSAAGCWTTLSETSVSFAPLTAQQIEDYWRTGEPLGKAGGYAVQGLAAAFISRIEGSYSGVVGLPLAETAALLQRAGVAIWRPV